MALEGGIAPSGGIISGRNEADRFVMGLLRAFADAVVVGAGTLRAEGRRALWTPDFIFPAAADAYRELRQTLERALTPQLVIVSGRGDLDPSHQALQTGALVFTTAQGGSQLRKRLPAAAEVRVVSDADRVGVDDLFRALAVEGYRSILTEGGPRLFGQLVASDRIDELFLTVSPVLAGQRGDRSFGLIRDIEFGRTPKRSRLLSVRRHTSHLVLRYGLERAG